jgi:hypothetical protein
MGVDNLAALHDGDGSGGNSALLHHIGGDVIDTRLECGIDGVDGLCMDGKSNGGK